MQIKAITTEQFVKVYEQLTNKIQQNLSLTTKAYTEMVPGIGKVVIISN